MNIIVNALPLTGLLTGISRYVRCLYTHMQQLPDISVSYFTGPDCLSEMPQQAEPVSWSRAVKKIWQLPDAFVLGLRTLHWLNFERLIRRTCKQGKCNLYHETAFVPAAVDNIPIVYTLHDLSLINHSATHPRERVWFFNLFFKRRISYASHIITVSEFMRNEIIEQLGIHPDTITAIHEAPDGNFYPRSKTDIEAILERYRLPREYVLFVGTLEPRKNMSLLIKALSRTRMDVPLILAGWKGWGDKKWLDDIKLFGLEKRVFFTDYVDEETLACLYSGASAFIYPSLYEGFGLPVLEAMACGCPVICSHVASLPEVAGDAALFIDPLDPDDLAHKIDQVLEDTVLRTMLVEKGLQRAKVFSWQKTAAQTLDVFKNVIAAYSSARKTSSRKNIGIK